MNLASIFSGVNVRASGYLSASILFTTPVVTYAAVMGINRTPDEQGFLWLEVRTDDGVEGWVRADKFRWLMGDFTLLHGGIADTPASVGKVFGAGMAPNSPTGKWPAPMSYSAITTAYNPATHPGIDLAAPLGTPVYARGKGTVYAADLCPDCPGGSGSVLGTSNPRTNRGYGIQVIVRYAYADVPASVQTAMDAAGCTGGWLFVRHAHLSRLAVRAGETVNDGTEVGREGTSGNSSGPHLHLETRVSMNAAPSDIWNETAINPALVFAV